MKPASLLAYYIYIVECSDGFFYVGITNDVERRVWEHNEGLEQKSFTYKRRPVTLRYVEHFQDVNQAIAREKQIKGWDRAKKLALIEQSPQELPQLSKNYSQFSKRK